MNTKDTILEQSLLELERSGVDNFSLRAVSAAVGVTPMAIYRHFRDKDHLLEAVGERAFAQWQQRVASMQVRDPLQWFRRSALSYVEFALDEQARFDACFVLNTNVERLYPQGFVAKKSPVITLVMERVVAAQASGKLRRGDPLEMTLFVWAQMHGLAMLHRSGRFTLKRAQFLALCERCVDRALIGLRPERKSRRKSA